MKSKMFLLFIITLLLSNSLLYAQAALKKGVYSLGGSIEYLNSKNTVNDPYETTTKSSYFRFQPSFSYFIIDNLSIGGSVSYFYSETEISSTAYDLNSKYISRQFGIGPSIRYYFETNNIVPFLGVGDAYSKDIDSEQESNTFNISGGFDYFLSNSIGLEPFLSYSIIHYNKPDQNVNSFSIGLRINYFIIN
jgi:Outer membrane protein beta-barrel domain